MPDCAVPGSSKCAAREAGEPGERTQGENPGREPTETREKMRGPASCWLPGDCADHCNRLVIPTQKLCLLCCCFIFSLCRPLSHTNLKHCYPLTKQPAYSIFISGFFSLEAERVLLDLMCVLPGASAAQSRAAFIPPKQSLIARLSRRLQIPTWYWSQQC